MEGDAPDDVVSASQDEHDAREMDVRFCGNQDALTVFDDMVMVEETVETRFMDNVDKNGSPTSFLLLSQRVTAQSRIALRIWGQATINKASGLPPLKMGHDP